MLPRRKFTAPVSLNNVCLKNNTFQLWIFEIYLSCCSCQASIVMPVSVSGTFFVSGIAFCIDEPVGFGIQQGIKSLFHTVFHKIFQFGVDEILVKLYNLIRHSSNPLYTFLLKFHKRCLFQALSGTPIVHWQTDLWAKSASSLLRSASLPAEWV